MGLTAPFNQWLSASIDGKASPATLGFRGVDAGGQSVRTALYSDVKLSSIRIPALGASNDAMALRVETAGMLKMEPAATASGVRAAAQPAGARWLASGFRMTLGGLKSVGVRRIDPFSLTPGGALALTVYVHDAAAQEVGVLLLKGKAADPKAAAPLLDGELQLLAATGQVLATIPLSQVQVTVTKAAMAGTGSYGATSTPAYVMTLRGKHARILFAPEVAQ
jgi:hypothetical protein